MTSEESEPRASQPRDSSAAPLAEDPKNPKNQEDSSFEKENGEVSEVAEAQTLHPEIKEEAKKGQENLGTGAVVKNEAKPESEAGASDRAEVEPQPSEVGADNEEKAEAEGGVPDTAEADTQPTDREAEVENGGHAENKAEPEAGAEPDSQADEESEASREPKPDADDGETTEAEGEEEEEKPRKLTVDDIKTAPMDFRFPTTNQAKHCFTRYIEYHKCVQAKGEDSSDCDKYARYYRSLCPGEWVDKWNEQRENGTFPGPL